MSSDDATPATTIGASTFDAKTTASVTTTTGAARSLPQDQRHVRHEAEEFANRQIDAQCVSMTISLPSATAVAKMLLAVNDVAVRYQSQIDHLEQAPSLYPPYPRTEKHRRVAIRTVRSAGLRRSRRRT